MSKVKRLSGTARAEGIRAFVLAAFAAAADPLAASVLPAIRAALADDPRFGGDAALYYGTADRVYFRAAGEANPFAVSAPTTKSGEVSSAFLRAFAARRNGGDRTLSRWDVLATSAGATLGRKVSVREAKLFYERAGWDLDYSYVGRGTRAGAEETRYEGDGARKG